MFIESDQTKGVIPSRVIKRTLAASAPRVSEPKNGRHPELAKDLQSFALHRRASEIERSTAPGRLTPHSTQTDGDPSQAQDDGLWRAFATEWAGVREHASVPIITWLGISSVGAARSRSSASMSLLWKWTATELSSIEMTRLRRSRSSPANIECFNSALSRSDLCRRD